jgi:hypothetical protein
MEMIYVTWAARGFFVFNFVMEPQLSQKKGTLNQIWLQPREESTNFFKESLLYFGDLLEPIV